MVPRSAGLGDPGVARSGSGDQGELGAESLRKHDGSGVSAFDDDPAALTEPALEIEQRGPDRWVRRYL